MSKPRDDGTFIEVYARYKAGIYHFCRRMLADNDVAKDVFQEVFVKFLENHDRLEDDLHVKNWLFKSARNKCLNFIRDKGKLSNFGSDVEKLPDLRGNNLGLDNSSEIIGKLLDNLSLDYREVLIMREWNDMSYAEIAAACDTTASAVKSKLFKARKKACEIYKKLYGDE